MALGHLFNTRACSTIYFGTLITCLATSSSVCTEMSATIGARWKYPAFPAREIGADNRVCHRNRCTHGLDSGSISACRHIHRSSPFHTYDTDGIQYSTYSSYPHKRHTWIQHCTACKTRLSNSCRRELFIGQLPLLRNWTCIQHIVRIREASESRFKLPALFHNRLLAVDMAKCACAKLLQALVPISLCESYAQKAQKVQQLNCKDHFEGI